MHSAQGIYIADPDYSVLNSQYNIHHCPRIQMVLEIVEQAVQTNNLDPLRFKVYLFQRYKCPPCCFIVITTLFFFSVDLMKPGTTVILRNAKIDMFKGSMRLAVDKWGRVEVTEPAEFVVKEDNNLSLVEYELVNVAEE